MIDDARVQLPFGPERCRILSLRDPTGALHTVGPPSPRKTDAPMWLPHASVGLDAFPIRGYHSFLFRIQHSAFKACPCPAPLPSPAVPSFNAACASHGAGSCMPGYWEPADCPSPICCG